MHRNLPTALWFQMKLKTREAISRVSPLGFSVTLGSRSQPLLWDTGAGDGVMAGSTASPPAPPRLEQLGWFSRWKGAGPSHTCDNRVPQQPAGPRFWLVRWQGNSGSPLHLATGTQQRHMGVAPGSQAAKPTWDLGGQSTHPSTTSLTCCKAHWTMGHLHANHPLRPCQQHCHQELQGPSTIQSLPLSPCIPVDAERAVFSFSHH